MTTLTQRALGAAVLCSAFAFAGCGGEGARCETTEREVGATDETALGFSAAEVLDAVGGERSGTLEWLGAPEGIRVAPDEGTTSVTVELVREQGDAIRVLDSRRVGGGNRRLACVSTLQIDATLHLRTDDGALDEAWPVTAETSDRSSLAIRLELREAGVAGDLVAQPEAPEDWDDHGASLDVQLTDSETDGALTLWTRRAGEEADAEGLGAKVAQWTAAP